MIVMWHQMEQLRLAEEKQQKEREEETARAQVRDHFLMCCVPMATSDKGCTG